MSDDKLPSDGLFTVVCERCSTVFPAEAGKCNSCGERKGDLKLDIDQMLKRVYDFMADAREDEAADVVFDVFYNLYSKFDLMSEVLSKVDVSKLNSHLMLAFMVQTFRYAKQVPSHLDFCDRCAKEMKNQGMEDARIHSLVDRYRQAGNYWDDMKMLGAPEWLTGPKPE